MKAEVNHGNWKPVYGHEDSYEVSDLGYVRSVDRVVKFTFKDGRPGTRTCRGQMLKHFDHRVLGISGKKIRTIRLCFGTGGAEGKTFNLARLVWEAFRGALEPEEFVHPINYDQTDCRLENLIIFDREQVNQHKDYSRIRGKKVAAS